jgi:DNA-binding MarR family transcriptional regulator
VGNYVVEVNNERVWALTRHLWALAQHVRRGQAASPHNASTVQLLALTAEHGRLRPVDIMKLLDLTAPSATRYVQALEQAGQVDVVADPNDGRTYVIEINDTGREVLAALRRDLLDAMGPVLEDFSADEVATLLELLGKLTASMAAHSHGRPVKTTRKNRWRVNG